MSNEIIPVTKQSPGVVTLENYNELKSAITEIANKYKNITYFLSDVKDAKSDNAELNKLKRAENFSSFFKEKPRPTVAPLIFKPVYTGG